MPVSEPLIKLANLRESLKSFLRPEILKELANFLQATGGDSSFIARYKWFCENAVDGPDCRYAALSKEFFLKDNAEQTAKAINWLYHAWSKFYEEKNDDN
ncbi:MAG: hypothetical protein DRH90_21610 [Deltaproteobacteria bacterium]|nr:MAG: hypothetical protein DRH90_21610 [Deltaproteobacteria bacterium]